MAAYNAKPNGSLGMKQEAIIVALGVAVGAHEALHSAEHPHIHVHEAPQQLNAPQVAASTTDRSVALTGIEIRSDQGLLQPGTTVSLR